MSTATMEKQFATEHGVSWAEAKRCLDQSKKAMGIASLEDVADDERKKKELMKHAAGLYAAGEKENSAAKLKKRTSTNPPVKRSATGSTASSLSSSPQKKKSSGTGPAAAKEQDPNKEHFSLKKLSNSVRDFAREVLNDPAKDPQQRPGAGERQPSAKRPEFAASSSKGKTYYSAINPVPSIEMRKPQEPQVKTPSLSTSLRNIVASISSDTTSVEIVAANRSVGERSAFMKKAETTSAVRSVGERSASMKKKKALPPGIEKEFCLKHGTSWKVAKECLDRAKSELSLKEIETPDQKEALLVHAEQVYENQEFETLRLEKEKKERMERLQQERKEKALAAERKAIRLAVGEAVPCAKKEEETSSKLTLTVNKDGELSLARDDMPAELYRAGVGAEKWVHVWNDVDQVLRPAVHAASPSSMTSAILAASNVMAKANYMLNPYRVYAQVVFDSGNGSSDGNEENEVGDGAVLKPIGLLFTVPVRFVGI